MHLFVCMKLDCSFFRFESSFAIDICPKVTQINISNPNDDNDLNANKITI